MSTITNVEDNINITTENLEIEKIKIVDSTPTLYSIYLIEYYTPTIISILKLYNTLLMNYSLSSFKNLKHYHLYRLSNKSISFSILKKKKIYRKRIFKKLKFLRFYKKLITHKKHKSQGISYKWSIFYRTIFRKKTTENILINKISLSQKLLNTSFLEFFYKYSKNKDQHKLKEQTYTTLHIPNNSNYFTIFLRNYHQKPYWKFRTARIIHWNFFFKKTLRQKRFNNFLQIYIKNYKKFSNVYVYLLALYSKLSLSQSRLQKISSFLKEFYINKLTCNLLIIPIYFQRKINWNFYKNRSKRLHSRLSRWSYLNFKRYSFPWLQRKKNFPKLVKHLNSNFLILKKLTHFDPMTGYLLILKKITQFSISFDQIFKTNYLLKLHNYRYKAN